MGFSGYKFLKNSRIEELMNDPEGVRHALRRRRGRGDDGQITIDFTNGSSNA
jgi:hypothetical protein